MASLNYFATGMSICGGLTSTMVYSLVHGTEEISATLEDASWIRKNICRKVHDLKGQNPNLGFLRLPY